MRLFSGFGPTNAALFVMLAMLTAFTGCGSSPEKRIAHIYELKRTPSDGSFERIRAYLADPDRDVRATALFALASAAAPAAPEVSLAGLEDPDPFVRATAVRCLGELKVPSTAPFVIQRLSDASWHVRQRAAEALGVMGGPEALVALARAVDDPVAPVRLAAVRAQRELRAKVPQPPPGPPSDTTTRGKQVPHPAVGN